MAELKLSFNIFGRRENIRSSATCGAPLLAVGCRSGKLRLSERLKVEGQLYDFPVISYDGERIADYSEADDPIPGMAMYDYELSRVFGCIYIQRRA